MYLAFTLLLYLILTKILGSAYYFTSLEVYLDFTSEETDAHKDELTCPGLYRIRTQAVWLLSVSFKPVHKIWF